MKGRAGVTLVELLVVLALLGVMAGIAGVTMHTAVGPPLVDPVVARVAAARDSAIRTGRPVTIAVTGPQGEEMATALPDGRVLAGPGLGIDPLTGRANGAVR